MPLYKLDPDIRSALQSATRFMDASSDILSLVSSVLKPFLAGDPPMSDPNLLQRLIDEAAEIAVAYKARDARELLTHACHGIVILSEHTTNSVDDQLASLAKLALEQAFVMEWLAERLERMLWSDDPVELTSDALPAAMAAQGVSYDSVGHLLGLLDEAFPGDIDNGTETDDVTVEEG